MSNTSNFEQFNTETKLLSSDWIVGTNVEQTGEIRIQLKDFIENLRKHFIVYTDVSSFEAITKNKREVREYSVIPTPTPTITKTPFPAANYFPSFVVDNSYYASRTITFDINGNFVFTHQNPVSACPGFLKKVTTEQSTGLFTNGASTINIEYSAYVEQTINEIGMIEKNNCSGYFNCNCVTVGSQISIRTIVVAHLNITGTEWNGTVTQVDANGSAIVTPTTAWTRSVTSLKNITDVLPSFDSTTDSIILIENTRYPASLPLALFVSKLTQTITVSEVCSPLVNSTTPTPTQTYTPTIAIPTTRGFSLSSDSLVVALSCLTTNTNCVCVSSSSVFGTAYIPDNRYYKLTFRVRGVFETTPLSAWTNTGTVITDHVLYKPSGFIGSNNIYSLFLDTNQYVLNFGYWGGQLSAFDYTFDLVAKGNSIYTLSAVSFDRVQKNNTQSLTANNNDSNYPLTITQPFSGQFMQLNLLSSVILPEFEVTPTPTVTKIYYPTPTPTPTSYNIYKIANLLIEFPCLTGVSQNCLCSVSAQKIKTITGEDGLYNATFRVRGNVELCKDYLNPGIKVSSTNPYVYNNPCCYWGPYNTYQLNINEDVYVLNYGENSTPQVLDYQITLPIRIKNGIATFEIYANSTDNTQGYTSLTVSDEDSKHPILVQQPYSGQFMQIDLLAIKKFGYYNTIITPTSTPTNTYSGRITALSDYDGSVLPNQSSNITVIAIRGNNNSIVSASGSLNFTMGLPTFNAVFSQQPYPISNGLATVTGTLQYNNSTNLYYWHTLVSQSYTANGQHITISDNFDMSCNQLTFNPYEYEAYPFSNSGDTNRTTTPSGWSGIYGFHMNINIS
jgi:hypothetical protein